MWESLGEPARRIVALAEEEASRLGHPHVGTEHLLLAVMLDETSDVAQELAGAGATLHGARIKVIEAVGRNSGWAAGPDTPFTARATRALERASRFCLQRRDHQVGSRHILLGILDVEGTAGQVLRGLDVDVGRLHEIVDSRAPERGPVSGSAERRWRPDRLSTSGGRALPRCPTCAASLEQTLASSTVTAAGAPPASFLVAYCSACGSTLGATPAAGTGEGFAP